MESPTQKLATYTTSDGQNSKLPHLSLKEANDEFLPAANCFISNQKIHFTPLDDSQLEQGQEAAQNALKTANLMKIDASYLPDKLYLKNKNRLYNLNNLSDLESETNGTGLMPPQSQSQSQPQSQSQSYLSPNAQANANSHEQAGLGSRLSSRAGSRSPSPSPSSVPESITSSLYFPKLVIDLNENLENEYKQLKRLLMRVFPQWLEPGKLVLKQVTGGITNMLLSCEYDSTTTVLIRVYGHGTNLIIDRHREFISHMILNSIGLAPPVFARFKNGMIYGFLLGRSLKPGELSNIEIYPLIAQQLGNWHNSLDYKLIEEGVEKIRTLRLGARRNSFSKKKKSSYAKKRFISNIWELIDDWIEIVPINPELIASFQQHLNIEVNETNLKEVVKEEFRWLQETLEKVQSPIVSCHCDLLSGNVIVPADDNNNNNVNNTKSHLNDTHSIPPVDLNPVKFIDYEYMLPAPRAFDIANHLAEWQGFDCDRSAIPTPTIENPTILEFCKSYLDCVGDSNDNDKIKELVNEIAMFYGLPGFYWGIWAMIQSELSNIDFDYANYGKLRLEEYWDWKSRFAKHQISV